MQITSKPRILIIYSNPSDTARLRLDKEHRAVEQVIQRLHLDPTVVTRLHATSVDDFVDALRANDYEVVQFSGHGSTQGIYLESSHLNKTKIVTAKQIAAILKSSSPKLKATIFISCFSSSSIDELIDAAPYLITTTDAADDDEAIDFIASFYDFYFRYGSIEQAFKAGLDHLLYSRDSFDLRPILSRRAKERGKERALIQVCPEFRKDSILVDLTEAEPDIQALDIARDEFLFLLTRKIEIHRWIFKYPKQRALLSIGCYFGLFSWEDANDVVICQKIMQLRPDVDEDVCAIYTSLILSYNDLWCASYRSVDDPAAPYYTRLIKQAIGELDSTYKYYFENEQRSAIVRNQVPEQFKVAKGLIAANLQLAESKFYQDDYRSTIMYLETTLSAFHDLIDSLSERLLIKSKRK